MSRVSAADMWLLRPWRRRAAARSVAGVGAGDLAGWVGGVLDGFGCDGGGVGAGGALGGMLNKWRGGGLLKFSMLMLPILYFFILVLIIVCLEMSRMRLAPLLFCLVDKATWPFGGMFEPMMPCT